MENEQIMAIIFDLDGTLLNSLEDIADTANEVLAKLGFDVVDVEKYNHFVGDGLTKLIERIMPENTDSTILMEGVAEFKKAYMRNWNKKTAPYPFIRETLNSLVEKNIKISILSNKPDVFTKEYARHFFPELEINPVIGQHSDFKPKPSAEGALKIAEILNIPVKNFMFVGDSNVDITTGIAAGMTTVGVAWGFRGTKELLEAGADIIINNPQELLEYV